MVFKSEFYFFPGIRGNLTEKSDCFYSDETLRHIRTTPKDGDYEVGIFYFAPHGKQDHIFEFSGVSRRVQSVVEKTWIELSKEESAEALTRLKKRFCKLLMLKPQEKAPEGAIDLGHAWFVVQEARKPFLKFSGDLEEKTTESLKKHPDFQSKVVVIARAKEEWTLRQCSFVAFALERTLQHLMDEKHPKEKILSMLPDRLVQNVQDWNHHEESIEYDFFIEATKDIHPKYSNVNSLQEAFSNGSWKEGESRKLEWDEVSKAELKEIVDLLPAFLEMGAVKLYVSQYVGSEND